MAKLTINAAWARRADAGRVLLTKQLIANVGEVTFGGKVLPEVSIIKIIEYGITQFGADSYAAKKDETVTFDDAKARLESRLDGLVTGDFSSRGGSGDPLAPYRRAIITDALSDKDRKAFDAAPKDGKAKWLDAFFASAADDFRKEVNAIAADALADVMKRKERARALKGTKA
jgi:hypothetical protein